MSDTEQKPEAKKKSLVSEIEKKLVDIEKVIKSENEQKTKIISVDPTVLPENPSVKKSN